MCGCWWHYCHSFLLASLRKLIGKPREKIGYLNGFEYRYHNGLKVPYYCKYPPLSRKVTSMGMTKKGTIVTAVKKANMITTSRNRYLLMFKQNINSLNATGPYGPLLFFFANFYP
jgi:hypothetical protein